MSIITYLLILLAIVAITKSELICPGYGFHHQQPSCVNECSPGNDTCAYGMKCCYTPEKPCGYRCLIGKQNRIKSGTCPPRQSEQSDMEWYICDGHSCDVDGDCPRKQKCCRNQCGAPMCIAPKKKSIKKN